MHDLILKFKCEKVIDWPKVKIFVDKELLRTIHFTQESTIVIIPFDFSSGLHRLEIEHFGKSPRGTLVEDGKVVGDTRFTIESISIDQVEFPRWLMWHCQFVANWSGFAKPKDFPDVIHKSSTVGPNGSWILDFGTPFIEWALDSKKIYNDDFQQVISTEEHHGMTFDINYKLNSDDRKVINKIKQMINKND